MEGGGDYKNMREPNQPAERPVRGLYDRVNISVGTLNVIIVILSILLVASIAFGVANRGYQVAFDTLGGTAVESQTRMYGELVEEPEPPTREGYVFNGWYLDENVTVPWNIREDTVKDSITLYAGWKKQ